MSNFKYHPDIINPEEFTPEWFGSKCAELLTSNPVVVNAGAVFGFDRQIHRWYTEGCDPEEYIQVWMQVEDSDEWENEE